MAYLQKRCHQTDSTLSLSWFHSSPEIYKRPTRWATFKIDPHGVDFIHTEFLGRRPLPAAASSQGTKPTA